MLPHLAADVGEYLVTVLQLNAEHRIGKGLNHAALDLDGTVFLAHILTDSCSCAVCRSRAAFARPHVSQRKSSFQDRARKSRREYRTEG